jgi:hypothetical protein
MAEDIDDKALDALDALLAEAARETPTPALRARVLADGVSVADAVASAPRPPRARGWRDLLDGFGGWRALSGVTAAGVMGLAIGLYAPGAVDLVLDGRLTALSDGGVTPDIEALLLAMEDLGDV